MMDSRRMTTVAALAVVELVILGWIFASFESLGGGVHHVVMAARAATSSSVPADVHTTISTTRDAQVRIEDDDAHITIKAQPVDYVRVDETTTTNGSVSGITPLRVQHVANGVIYIGRREWYHGSMHRDIAITVPVTATIEVANCTSLTLSGLSGSASVKCTGSDSVDVSDFHGRNLEIRNGDARVSVARSYADHVMIVNDDGNVDLADVRAQTLDVHTDDGRITGNAIAASNGAIQTDDGNVALNFAGGTNVTVAVKTDANVTAVSPLTLEKLNGDDDDERGVRLGNGGGRLDIKKTGDGSVTLSGGGL